MLNDFKPPAPQPWLIWLVKQLGPFYIKHCAQLSIHLTDEFHRVMAECVDKRAVFLFNHPDRLDPVVLCGLQASFKQPCSCLVARECFDWDRGLRGLFFQSVGCYSVNRGTVDRKSIRTTRELLQAPGGKLIVFPEGKITCDSHHVQDLQKSFLHIVLDAQSELSSQNSSNSILIVPVAINYQLLSDLETSFPSTLDKIERKLKLPTAALTTRERVQRSVERLTQDLLDVYDYSVAKDLPLAEKLELLASHICHKIGNYLNIQPEKCDTKGCHLYLIRNALASAIDEIRNADSYEKDVFRHLSKTYKQFVIELDRVERLLICAANLKSEQTDLQVCRTADFVEQELFGRMTAKGKQCATVNCHEPISVASYLPLYERSKKAAVHNLCIDAKIKLQQTLESLNGVRNHEKPDRILEVNHQALA